MHIVVIRRNCFGADGVSRVIECWARVLQEAGHEVTLLFQDSREPRPFPDLPGVRSAPFEVPASSRMTGVFRGARAAMARLRRLQHDRRIDLIISHDSLLAVRARRGFPALPVR